MRVPPGYTAVDVKLDDGEMFDCAMVAGMVGMRVSSSHDLALSETGTDDVVQPVSGWWMYIKKEGVLEETQESDDEEFDFDALMREFGGPPK